MFRWATYLVLLAAPAMALAAPPEQWVPVDQAVADLDPLATSLRRVETGLRNTGEQSTLYRLSPSTPGSWYLPSPSYRVGPGFRARVDRLDYLVRFGKRDFGLNVAPPRDGQFIEMVTANTVFELTPLPPGQVLPTPTALPGRAPSPYEVNGAVDPRINGQIDGRVGAQRPVGPTSWHVSPLGPGQPMPVQALQPLPIQPQPLPRLGVPQPVAAPQPLPATQPAK